MKTLPLLAQVILLFAACFVSPVSALTVPERLVYDVNWGGIKAGTAVQEVTAQGGRLRIVNTIVSSRVLSMVFAVDDCLESLIDRSSDPVTPIFFRERINEGKTHTLKEARFDFRTLTVRTRDLLKKTEGSDSITPRTYDSLSSVFFIRCSELALGQTVFFDLYDFKRLWNSEVRVVRREEIRTPLGTFKTLVVTSQLTFKGAPAAVGSTTVWLSEDSRRIPVRIKTKIRVGEITMTLVGGSYWPPANPPQRGGARGN